MSYAADLTPAQAWDRLAQGAVLVDVRTAGEWAQIGVPDVPATAAAVVFAQWNLADGSTNPAFLAELTAAVPAGTELLLLCRSGVRSIAAARAATAAGYPANNVLEGFEGAVGPDGGRSVNGWKNRALPWHVPA